MSNVCNLSEKQLEELNTRVHAAADAKAKPGEKTKFIFEQITLLDKKMPGLKEQFEDYLKRQTEKLKISVEETKELDALVTKGLSGSKSFLKNLSGGETARIFVLLDKAALTLGSSTAMVDRLKTIIDIQARQTPEVTVSALEVLEKKREVALRNGDTEMANKLESLMERVTRANDISNRLKIDWDTIQKVQEQRDDIFTEIALLEVLKQISDSEVIAGVRRNEKARNELRAKLEKLKKEKKIIRNADMPEDEEEEALRGIDEEIAQIQKKITKLDESILKGLTKKARDRRDTLDAKLASLNLQEKKLSVEYNQLSFVETLITTAIAPEEFYVTSARDLIQKRKKVNDEIKFVRATIDNAGDDYQFTRAELERLFGKDIANLPMIRAKFIESVEDPATKKQTKKEKNTISKNEVLEIFDNWSSLVSESIYDPTLDSEDVRLIEGEIKRAQKDIITDVSPDDPQPISRTRLEAQKTTVGYQYQVGDQNDRVRLVTDLQRTLGRFNTLSKLTRFNGLIPEWALVSALGTDAQSLFSLFDGALVDPQSINYSSDSSSMHFENDHQRRTLLRGMLSNFGVEENQFSAMPENREDFKSDFRTVIGVSFVRNTEGQIIGVSQTIRQQDPSQPARYETRELISSSAGLNQPLTQEDALSVLLLLEEQMNSGYKIFGHGLLSSDGDLEALVLQSKDTKLGMRVALRVHDTALLAFKGAIGNGFTRHNTPSISSLGATAGLLTIPTNADITQGIGISNTVEMASAQSAAVINIALTMVANNGKQIEVNDQTGKAQIVVMPDVVPLWFDGNGNQSNKDQNANFKGLSHLFDIQVLSNLRDFRGHAMGRSSMYDLAKLQAIATNLMLLGIQETNPDELNNILSGLVAMPDKMDRNYDLVMKLSKRNHAAYLPIKKEIWQDNNQQFIISEDLDADGTVVQRLDSSAEVYAETAVNEVFETLRAYFRKPEFAIAEFAKLIGFREQNGTELTPVYLAELFIFANKQFNNNEYSFVDYGNANYDYISAKQLGRGFAQIILGHIREGNSLTQNIDTPIGAAAATKEQFASDNIPLEVTNLEQKIEERTYLPATRTNISYFSPLSMYEQERTFSDWALRQRYRHILNKTISAEDRTKFEEFIKENRIIELKNSITAKKTEIDQFKKNPAAKDKLEQAEKELQKLKEDYNQYMEKLDDQRLEQGRVQAYRLINPVNNKDLFTRIPTIQESIEMSLEVAAEIPQLLATYVHDSRNYIPGSKVHLAQETYMADPGKSAGGPGAKATWAGIHPLMAFLVMYPQQYRPGKEELNEMIREAEAMGDKALITRLKQIGTSQDRYGIVNLTPDLLAQALEEGRLAREAGVNYSKSTYFDDKFSGIHHLVAAQEAYAPSRRQKSLLEELLSLKNGGMIVNADQLTDYYNETYKLCVEQTEKLRDKIKNSKFSPAEKAKRLEKLEKVIKILTANAINDGSGSPNKNARDLFKGVVIPVIYSGGYDAVYKDLKNRRNGASPSKPGETPSIGDLDDTDLATLAHALTSAAGGTMGRLCDEVMDLDTDTKTRDKNKATLIKLLIGDTPRFRENYLLDIKQLVDRFPDVADDFVNHEMLRGAITARLKYVADLSIQPSDVILAHQAQDPGQVQLTVEQIRNKLVEQKAEELQKKWEGRINKALARIEEYHKSQGNNGEVGYELGSELDREVNIILAGGNDQFKTQASLLFLNKAQNTGFKINNSAEAMLEARVKNGRYIADSDLMFTNMVLFHSAAYGTSTGRMQYPGNYLTNLQGGSLSKGKRLVYDENDQIDIGESVLNSMWEMTQNPLGEITDKTKAYELAKDLAIKNYALLLATDYPPDYLGYDLESDENRDSFFKQWKDRSETERTFGQQLQRGGKLREEYKKLFKEQQISLGVAPEDVENISDDDIDREIESNSVAFDKRETIRIMAPDALTREEGTLITMRDAKGLGAFIPRLADHDFKDQVIHGLYTIHHGSKRLRLKAGKALLNIRRAQAKEASLQDTMNNRTTGSSVYDAKDTPFIPVSGDSLPEFLLDHDPPITQKIASMQNSLDTFAYEYGYDTLVDNKDYPRLYQIYQIHLKLRRLTSKLHRMNPETISARELRMEHRNLVLSLFKLTKFQRDASKRERSILDFQKAVSIDPSKFKYKNGQNMMYLDVLKVLAKLGIDELYTLQFGVSPVELRVLGEDSVDVLKSSETITKPFYVQGHDVATLIMEVLANDVIKREATELIKQKVKNKEIDSSVVKFDPQGFVILSDLPAEINAELLKTVLENDDLINSVANNLNLYVVLEWAENNVATSPHANVPTAFITSRRGLGDPVVNRTRTGFQQARFMLTAEAIKRILTGARNHGLLTMVETAVQTNKYLGTRTNVDLLRSERFRETGDVETQRVAEEVEILQHLMGPDKQLRMLLTRGQSELRDEHGLALNPYDAESYFYETGEPTVANPKGIPEYAAMTPFKAAISSHIRQAIKLGSPYITLQEDVQKLRELYNGNSPNFTGIAYIIYLKYSAKELGNANYKILVEEAMGVESLTDKEFEALMNKANEYIAIIDKIKFSPTKGVNPYLSIALRAFEQAERNAIDDPDVQVQDLPDVQNPQYRVREGRNFRIIQDPMSVRTTKTKDVELKAQAIQEARNLRNKGLSMISNPAYPNTDPAQIFAASYDGSEISTIIPGPEGDRISMEIDNLVANKVITEDTAVFYRYMVISILRNNPNLAPLLSITSEYSSSNIKGSASKQADKYTITLNTRLMQNMGTVDQVRVFAHEMAHIARLAFIRDNSKEWNQIVSLFRSKKGKDTITTMMLAMNNGKKYIGFDDDVNYYLSHPEEFAAQWGGWILFQKTFNNHELMQRLQKWNRGAAQVNQTWQNALHAVSDEITGIGLGLTELDLGLRNEIFQVVDNMFGFTADAERQIFVENENNQLFAVGNLIEPISLREEGELRNLHNMPTRNAVEEARYQELSRKYQVYSVHNMNIAEYSTIQRERNITNNGNYVESPVGTNRNELEVIQTFVRCTVARSATQSRGNHTFGGLTRNLSEKIFGVQVANRIINARHLLTMGVGSRYTYDSTDPIISGLMNVLSDTLSMHSYQFQNLGGSSGIRENRIASRRLYERVSYELSELHAVSESKAEFLLVRDWAVKIALGLTIPDPATSTPEVLAQGRQVASAMRANSSQMNGFINGSFAGNLENLPIQFETDLLGTGDPNKVLTGVSSSTAKRNQRNNRELFQRELANMIRNRILNGEGIDGNVIYVMNLLPREVNIETLREFQNNQPQIFAALRDLTIDRLATARQLEDRHAARLFDLAVSDRTIAGAVKPSFEVEIQTGISSEITTQDILNAFSSSVNTIYNLGVSGTIGREAAVHQAILDAAILSIDVNVNGLSALVSDSRQVNLPAGIMRIRSNSAFSETELQGNPSEVLAKLFLGHVGNEPHYLNANGFMTMRAILENPQIDRFVDGAIDKSMYQLERTQGYRRSSEIAIQAVTGIGNLDIFTLINLIRSNITSLKVKNPGELLKSLAILEEKVRIDQGLGIRDIAEKHSFFEFMAKWGPDIVRLTHGSNLNTASMVVEGTMGAIISTMYGGNPARFIGTLFGSFTKTYFGKGMTEIAQRGAAVNLLLGIERMVQDAREVMHISDTNFDRNAGKVQKLRDWVRQSNNRGFMAVQAAMGQQAQLILRKNLLNGNLDRLARVVQAGYLDPSTNTRRPIANITELKEAMQEAGISRLKLNSHMAFIIMQSGLLQEDNLRAFRHMSTVVDNRNTGRWGLDLQAAGRWLERTRWDSNGAIRIASGDHVFRASAQKAIEANYQINREFTQIVTVENNAFDSATSTSALQSLFFFYRQYPNLFLAQKVFRLSGRMDKTTFVALLISSTVMDILYNMLLLIASGAITAAALNPLSEEFLLKKHPWEVVRTWLTRNPVFSPLGNLIAESMFKYKQASDKVKVNKYQNRYTQTKSGITNALNEMMPDFTALSATKTLFGGTLPTAAIGISTMVDSLFFGEVGGSLNDQEYWDMQNDVTRTLARTLPGMELPLRMLFPDLIKTMFGERPVRLPIRPLGSSEFTSGKLQPKVPTTRPTGPTTKPTVVPRPTGPSSSDILKKVQEQAKTPIQAPSGFGKST